MPRNERVEEEMPRKEMSRCGKNQGMKEKSRNERKVKV